MRIEGSITDDKDRQTMKDRDTEGGKSNLIAHKFGQSLKNVKFHTRYKTICKVLIMNMNV